MNINIGSTAISRCLRCLTTLACLMVFAQPADAQYGAILSGAGPVNRSMAGTATAAPLSASGALLWNPATLSGLRRSELEIGAELLVPYTTLSSSVPANTFGPGFPASDLSGTTENEDAVFALPSIGLSYRPEGSDFTYGLGLLPIAGFGLDYSGSNTNPILTAPPPNGIGFGPVYSEYSVLQIAPALVLDLTERFSVSFSPLLNIANLQISPAIIAAPDDANGDGFATYSPGANGSTSWGAGFGIGTFYEGDVWNFGVSYKSQQWFEDHTFNIRDELGNPRRANVDLDLPSIVSVGTAWKGLENAIVAVDMRYLDYANSDFVGDSGFNPDGSLSGLGLKSIFAVSVGSQVQLTERLTARMGYSWNENPIRSEQTAQNTPSPILIQNMLSAGGSFQVSDALTVSAGYSHAFKNSSTGEIVLPSGPVPGTSISSSAAIDMFLFGATVKFGPRVCAGG